MSLFARVTISSGPLKISLLEPWNVATANLSNLVLGSDLREFINLNASIEDKFFNLISLLKNIIQNFYSYEVITSYNLLDNASSYGSYLNNGYSGTVTSWK